mgnify:CR=1 FL=1
MTNEDATANVKVTRYSDEELEEFRLIIVDNLKKQEKTFKC